MGQGSVSNRNIVSKTEIASKKAETKIRYYKTKARKYVRKALKRHSWSNKTLYTMTFIPKGFCLVTCLEFQKSNHDKSIQVKEFGEKFNLKGERINILYIYHISYYCLFI